MKFYSGEKAGRKYPGLDSEYSGQGISGGLSREEEHGNNLKGNAERPHHSYGGEGRRLRALVVPDYEQAENEGVDKNDLPGIMQNNLKELNAQLAAYERVAEIVLYPTEFEKTPKRSIKRYLYTTSVRGK